MPDSQAEIIGAPRHRKPAMKIEHLPAGDHPAERAPAPAHPAYRPDIDGMRALAVLAVVVYHAFPKALPGGFAGVDIFFIISGFLIFSILMGSLREGSFSFADFYARRVRRIFPALALVLSACIAFGYFALFPDEFKQLGKHVFGGTAFVSNFFLWNEVGYFDTAAETKPLLHLWSLGIEEQFYIFWPVILVWAHKRGKSVAKVLLALAALSFLVNIGGLHRYPSATFYSPASRVWELLLGALLAWLSVHRYTLFAGLRQAGREDRLLLDPGSARARDARSVLGLALVACGYAFLSAKRGFPGWAALLPTLGAVMLISAGPRAWVNRVILSNRVLVWFGLISYPLYLWHWPLLSFAQIVESGVPAAKIRAAAVLAAVALAWLTYRLVERPLRGAAHGRAKVAALSLAMIAVAAAGGYLVKRDGLPKRGAVVDNALQQKDLILVEDVANAKACKERYGFASLYEYCLLDDPKKDPTVLLIGDSHAYHLVAGQTRYWRGQGENLWMLGTRIPFIGVPVGDDPYQKATPMMMDLALKTASVKTVIISTAQRVEEQSGDGKARTAALRETLRRLLAAGKQVIWANDVPRLDFEPRACIRRGAIASSQTRADCAMPRQQYEREVELHKTTMAAVLREFPQVRLFDAASGLCDAQRCKGMADGVLLYRDNNHLSYRGDLLVGEAFARWRRENGAP
ncbi:Peptidoglycan/LPS O-acetylase OafA/YrhL, contains acyltransferase and SGNH-hydrolase domains [Pseudoduganella namucuonensis]|uniref:Peptidoglycan/LPS O-acetylase OafA/YrhL, contains acyltransferase and SGNH-hydrolase domains n=2 Tax=Pseudoduganella namucuonensis TaxID=1035707 RepID=A0A1I7FSZ7_9BURK|nr:Peptidoglycan/LPS O-acetylase OafA/YrhL, contains acyltransferase and SGNH-hydrolase domains [Pseudoduganella namucuonensis]